MSSLDENLGFGSIAISFNCITKESPGFTKIYSSVFLGNESKSLFCEKESIENETIYIYKSFFNFCLFY